MRLEGELFEAFEELYSSIYDVRAMLTRHQRRRLEDAVENLKATVIAVVATVEATGPEAPQTDATD